MLPPAVLFIEASFSPSMGRKLQAMLGHKSAVETLDIYSHLIGDEDDRSREIMQEALGACHGNATVEPLAERLRRSNALGE